MADHPIWFERVISPELLGQIGLTVEILGPGIENASDPYAGIENAAGIMASVLPYTEAVMDRAANAVVIARTGIGVDRVDIGAATDRTIAVCNTPDGPTVSTAEHAVALILAVAKGLTRSAEALRLSEGNYYSHNQAIELDGKSLGLVGFGRIARRVGRAAQGLGMNVLAYDPFVSDEGLLVTRVDSLDKLLALSDVVSIHVPLTTDTRYLFDRARFQMMRSGSILVNTSRGSVVDQSALIEALDSGQLFGAGLDVTEPEPLPPDHTLLHRPNVIVTPHIASGTVEGRERIFLTALAQVLMALNGQRPDHLVNPEVWPHIEKRLAERTEHGQ
jgi:phosphoglycerate dehydrogenase-like enzyme